MTNFSGYPRPDGTFGVRNYVLVLSTVGCANGTVRQIAARVPGAVCLENVKGCGQIGKGIEIMERCLANIPLNPNVYGTLIVGLGCESTKPHELAERVRAASSKPLEVLTIQEEGGTDAAVEAGVAIVQGMADEASKIVRVPCPLSSLVLATNCGGSDATSGLAANPSLGVCADQIVVEGGTVFLGETTELIGTEHILIARAKDEKVAQDIQMIIGDLEHQFIANNIDVRGANPTPGNMKGGLSTLEEKALGSMQKGGSSPVNEVVSYGCRPQERGLIIMDTPGYDIESVSGMIAAGAQVCVFTSGRGTPVGSALAPMIKISGNHQTFENMKSNIDMDVSSVIDGTCSVDEMGATIFDELIEVCNGKQTKAEQHGFEDFAIYHNQEIWCYCEP